MSSLREANLLAGPQRVHAGGHHQLAPFEPSATTMVEESWCRSSTGLQRHLLVAGSTTQTAGRLSIVVRAVAGSSMPPFASMRVCPVLSPETHGFGPPGQPDLHPVALCYRVRLRRDLPYPTDRVHGRIVGQGDVDDASGDTWRMRLAGTSNTASAPSACATVTIIWPAWTTSPASAPVAITPPEESARNLCSRAVFGSVQLCGSGIDLGFCAVERLLRCIEGVPVVHPWRTSLLWRSRLLAASWRVA